MSDLELGTQVKEAVKKWKAAGKEAPANEAVFIVRLKQMLSKIHDELVLEVKDTTAVSHFQRRTLIVRISNLTFATLVVDVGEVDKSFTTTPNLELCQIEITRQISETCAQIKKDL